MKKLSKKFESLIDEVRDVEKDISDLDMNDGSYIIRFNCIKQLLDDIRIDLQVKDRYRKEVLDK